MKELFSINTGKSEPGGEKLSIRLGDRHCSYAVTDISGNELFELAYCSTGMLNELTLSAFRSAYPKIAAPYRQVQISFDNSRSLLIPSWCYRPDEAVTLLKTLEGDTYGCDVISEALTTWQMYNIYGLPMDVQDWLNQQYPVKHTRHQYSLLLKSIPAIPEGCLLVDLGPTEFSVMASLGSRLLAAQSYEYNQPADVLFQLLKICQSFDLKQEDVDLRVSGLIDEQSVLYRDLHQYFVKISLRHATWNTPASYPAQFFTALNDLALCAS
jgi:hypothetical protein